MLEFFLVLGSGFAAGAVVTYIYASKAVADVKGDIARLESKVVQSLAAAKRKI